METSKIEAILDRLCQEIGGDWLLVGGALVQLHINSERATEDIDLAMIAHPEKSSAVAQNELFKFSMQDLQIGPESVNLAVDFFLNEISDWKSNCVLIRSGQKGKVFRPNLSLFIALKLNRGSTIDLQDIKGAMATFSREEYDQGKLSTWLNKKQLDILKKLINSNDSA